MPKSSTRPQLIHRSAILAITLLAFALRLFSLTRFNFHIDEFFTLAAAKFITQTGAPTYPTGLFYDPGLIFSYLDALIFRLFGFSEALGRWPSVLFGTLAVVTVYWLGARALRSSGVGLLAACWLAISFDSLEWSARARMITLAQWLGLLAVALLWLGLTRNSTRYRLAFAATYALTLFTHLSTVVLMPGWVAATAALWWAKAIKPNRTLLREAVVLLALFGLVLAAGVYFQPPPSPDFTIGATNLGDKTEALTGKFLQFPSDVGHAWDTYGHYFLALPHGPVLALALIGLIISGWRLAHQRPPAPPKGGISFVSPPSGGPGGLLPRDLGAIFPGSIFITVILVLALAVSPHWQRARYLLMQGMGLFFLLGAHGLRELVSGLMALLPASLPKRSGWQIGLTGLLVIGLALPFWPPLSELLGNTPNGWDRYDLALGHVKEKMNPGDKIMSMHPPAALLYLEQSDYYLDQSAPKLITRPDGRLGDRYSGALWLHSAEEFNQLIAGPDKIWLVTQEFWLFNSYAGLLQQQILAQMDKQWGEGGVWALSTRPGAWPLAAAMETPVAGRFEGGAQLFGYTVRPSTPAPGGVLYFTLFWQGDNFPQGAKIFFHLRDTQNNTVAQADHFIYDGKVPTSRWDELAQNDTAIRDGAALPIPPDLAPGRYRLLVGFYHPQTFERLPVLNDRSGENAIVLAEFEF
jgi:hypothetical protein